MFPEFHTSLLQPTDRGDVVGTLTSTQYGDQSWVEDGWLGYLLFDDIVISGRWRLDGGVWAFAPEAESSVAVVRARDRWFVLDVYWGERAQLVLDRSLEWQRIGFKASAGIAFPGNGGTLLRQATPVEETEGSVIEGAWDHEHCAIDCETISELGHSHGFFSPPNHWVCEACYQAFVKPRSLSFIPGT